MLPKSDLAGGGGAERPRAKAVGFAADREIVGLRAKADGVLDFQSLVARPPKGDVLAVGIECEAGVQPGRLLLIIAPDNKVALGR